MEAQPSTPKEPRRRNLLDLPPELLNQILNHLDVSLFRKDLGLLTVSKHWHSLVLRILFRDLNLTGPRLLQLTSHENLLSLIPLFTSSVHIHTTGGFKLEPYSSPLALLDAAQLRNSKLNASIGKLATSLQRSSRPLRLKIKTCDESEDSNTIRIRIGYILQERFTELLNLQNLTKLKLDVAESLTSREADPGREGRHLCKAIVPLYRTRKKLYVRMDMICPALFPLGSSSATAQMVSECDIPLENLTIDLCGFSNSRRNFLQYDYFMLYSPDEYDLGGDEYDVLVAAIEEQVQRFTRRMENPEVVQVLSFEFPGLTVQAQDILTGERD